MNAIYRNRLCRLVETSRDVAILTDEGRELTVPLASEGLVIDPTDRQVAGADNLSNWYGVETEAADDLRAMLCGELSTAEWQSRWRAS